MTIAQSIVRTILKPAHDLKPGDKLWRGQRILTIKQLDMLTNRFSLPPAPAIELTFQKGPVRIVHPAQFLRIEP